MEDMAKKTQHLELLCIICSGGNRDARGAHTVCALCELQGLSVPELDEEALAA